MGLFISRRRFLMRLNQYCNISDAERDKSVNNKDSMISPLAVKINGLKGHQTPNNGDSLKVPAGKYEGESENPKKDK